MVLPDWSRTGKPAALVQPSHGKFFQRTSKCYSWNRSRQIYHHAVLCPFHIYQGQHPELVIIECFNISKPFHQAWLDKWNSLRVRCRSIECQAKCHNLKPEPSQISLQRGAWHSHVWQKLHYLYCFVFQFGGLSPPKPPLGDGTAWNLKLMEWQEKNLKDICFTFFPTYCWREHFLAFIS